MTNVDVETQQYLQSTSGYAPITKAIKTDQEQEQAAALLGGVKEHLSRLTAKEKAIIDPLNQSIKEVRELFKPAKARMEEVEASVKVALVDYHVKRDTQSTRKAEAIEADLEAGKLTIEQATVKLGKIGQPDTTIQTVNGTVQFRQTPEKVRIVNPMILPPEYFSRPDVMEALRKEIDKDRKAGIPVPDGAEVYRDTIVAGVA